MLSHVARSRRADNRPDALNRTIESRGSIASRDAFPPGLFVVVLLRFVLKRCAAVLDVLAGACDGVAGGKQHGAREQC
ncbi:protein of unknown function [Pararobbsia alpina]